MVFDAKSILVIAPHPDDEILGAGGTLLRCGAEMMKTYVCIVTKGFPPRFDPHVIETGRREAALCHRQLGVLSTSFLDFPAAGLAEVPEPELTEALSGVLETTQPEVVLLPYAGDLHLDHRVTFSAGMVALRPHSAPSVKYLMAYETLSETNWSHPALSGPFSPTVFVDISRQLDEKLELLSHYASQLMEFPHERSLEAARNLARYRGASVGLEAAEAFVSIRQRVLS